MRIQCTCLQCGAVFSEQPANVARGQGKYCSRTCWARSRGGPPVERVCERCGAAFTAKPSEVAKGGARYCSRSCRDAGPLTDLATRFWPGVDRSNPDGCWPWMRAKRNEQGHGGVWDGKRWTHAHRVAYTLAHGPIPAGMHVCHRCDNPPCCRPDHLFLGTPQDNMADMVEKRRSKTLTVEIEQEALALLRTGATQRQVAAALGIGKTTVARIGRGSA